MISDFNEIEKLFKQIDKVITEQANIVIIGGAVLLYQGLKTTTKDIDIVVQTKKEFTSIKKALKQLGFIAKLPSKEYQNMNLTQIFQKQDFRIDIFEKRVCGGFSLSKEMINRGHEILKLENMTLFNSSNEDIFLFKTMTQRQGDIEDCITLAQKGLNWNIVLKEITKQIKNAQKPVWITWIGERLDILVEKKIFIPIMKEINKLRNEFFNYLEGKQAK